MKNGIRKLFWIRFFFVSKNPYSVKRDGQTRKFTVDSKRLTNPASIPDGEKDRNDRKGTEKQKRKKKGRKEREQGTKRYVMSGREIGITS